MVKQKWLMVGLASIFISNIVMGQESNAPVAEKKASENEPKKPITKEETPKPTKNAVLETEKISVTRVSDEGKLTSATAVSTVSNNEMKSMGARTLPDALLETPGVMVQRTSYGQASPFIRGFTGFRNLMLIDGVRFNNSVFREGPNQYWSTIDANSLKKVEVMRGAGSVQYGSDAVGGVVNGITRDYDFSEKRNWGAREIVRYSSAERSWVSRTEAGVKAGSKLEISAGFTNKDYNDLEGGRRTGLQPRTGYEENNGDAKIKYHVNDNATLTAYHQNTNQNDVWRTHSTVYGTSFAGSTVGDEKARILFQDRSLSYLQYEHQELFSFMDNFKVNLNYQYMKERQWRIKKDDTADNQGFTDGVIGVYLQAESKTSFGAFNYGIDIYNEKIESFLDKYKADGSFNSSEIQGPVGDDSSYMTTEAYVQHKITFKDVFSLLSGLRFTSVKVEIDKFKDPVTKLQDSISESYSAVVGNLKFQYIPETTNFYNFYTGVSQSFRAPNLSDLSRLDTARSGEIEIASPGLDPEQFITFDLGFKTVIGSWEGEIGYFYTIIDDMIVRTPTGDLDGTNAVVTKKNSGTGFVHGVELSLAYKFLEQYKVFGHVSWQDGELESYPDSTTVAKTEPLSRLLPLSGLIGIKWNSSSEKCWVEMVMRAAAKQDELNASDKRDTQRIPPNGTPGYATFALRGGVIVNDYLTVTGAIENIGNIDYRIHGSGVTEPGTNFILTANISY